MNDVRNPYTPPKAEITSSDRGVDEPNSRPTAVNIALFLIGVQVLFSAMGVINVLGAFETVIGVLDVALMAFLCVFIARGRNWARIVFLALWALELVFLVFWYSMVYGWFAEDSGTVKRVVSWSGVGQAALPQVLSLTTSILLFGPGRGWFRKRGTI